jgi:hypothetical protein
MSFLIAFLTQILAWLHTFLVLLPKLIASAVLTALAAVINWIPVPSFITNASGWIGAIPSFPAYLLSSLNFSAGVTILVTAYVLRFLIRRIPFIG